MTTPDSGAIRTTFNKVLRRLRGDLDGAAPAGGNARRPKALRSAQNRPGAGPMPTDPGNLEAHLQRACQGEGKTFAGKLQIICLEDVRDELGQLWGKFEEQAMAVAENVLRRRLTAVDVFARVDGNSFVALFSNLTEAQARFKAAAIKQEIRDRLLGEMAEDGRVWVRAAVAEAEKPAEPAQASADGASADGASADGASAGGASAGGASAGGASADGNSVLQSVNRVLDERLAKDMAEESADLEALISKVTVAFRPTLNARKNVISIFTSVPVRVAPSGKVLTGTAAFPKGGQGDFTFCIDLWVVRSALQQMRLMRQSGRLGLVIVPVRFHSLIHKDRNQLVALFKGLSEKARRYLVVEIVGTPLGTPSSRILEASNLMRPLARAVILRLSPPLEANAIECNTGIGLAALGLHTEDIAAAHGDDFMAMVRVLMDFATRAKRHGFQSYVFDVHSKRLAEVALASGFDYINGDAIEAQSDVPASLHALHTGAVSDSETALGASASGPGPAAAKVWPAADSHADSQASSRADSQGDPHAV